MKRSKDPFASALKVQKGIEQPPQTNADFINNIKQQKYKIPTFDEFFKGIKNGDLVLLSRAITLIESIKVDHQSLAQRLIEACLPLSGNSIRIGITGVPGAGKSTFIESFGTYLTEIGKKVAVLAIDPSSQISKGSILGDKTRMEKLSTNVRAFIRPSPSAGTLGGVAQKTRESMILCEAAGFDVVLIETVGVGQSETAARSMVDFFLLLQIAGAGDELQGIKRGIMEMADAIFVNKVEGDNINKAKLAASEIRNALHLMPAHQSGWVTPVGLCSALNGTGIKDVWNCVQEYVEIAIKTNFFENFRQKQEVNRFKKAIDEILIGRFFNSESISNKYKVLENKIFNSEISPYTAAQEIVDEFYKKISND